MYDPKGNGIEKTVQSVQFVEVKPPNHLSGVVHRFLELKTDGVLANDYRFHALPDACTYIVFDQLNKKITGVSKLRAVSEEFNLGQTFHFVNVRFLPGVWQGDLPLININNDLSNSNFTEQQIKLATLVEQLIEDGLVVANPVTEKIFQNMSDIHTVADMADVSQLSPRQLQRNLKRTTGFAPHDFLKVLRYSNF